MMHQFNLTPQCGKRLIAKALANYYPPIQNALKNSTIAIIAGTTNGYLAEELLKKIGQDKEFDKSHFFRGITLPPKIKTDKTGRLNTEVKNFPGDVIIEKGVWQKGKTILDVIDNLKKDDIIIKGANALDPSLKKAGILIGNPKGGTIVVALQAVLGRRTRLIIPVGLEKRVMEDIDDIAFKLNRPESSGWRMITLGGAEIVTEIHAIWMISDYKADATLIAAGGVGGAEGSVMIAVESEERVVIDNVKKIIGEILNEPPFELTPR